MIHPSDVFNFTTGTTGPICAAFSNLAIEQSLRQPRVSLHKDNLRRFLTDRTIKVPHEITSDGLNEIALKDSFLDRKLLVGYDREGADLQFKKIVKLFTDINQWKKIEIDDLTLKWKEILKLLQSWRDYNELKILRITGCALSLLDAQIVSEMSTTKITLLELSCCSLGKNQLKILAGKLAQLPLEVLVLENNHIADTGAIILAKALHKKASLCKVFLGGNKIQSRGANALMHSLLTTKNLCCLNLDKNRLSFRGIRAVAHIAANGKWETERVLITLTGNARAITKDERTALVKDKEQCAEKQVKVVMEIK